MARLEYQRTELGLLYRQLEVTCTDGDLPNVSRL